MTVGYVVLSHRDADGVLRLVSRLLADDARARVFVHHDVRAELGVLATAVGHPRVELLRLRATDWGSWQLVEAVLDGLRAAVQHDDCAYVSVVSGSDYPLARLDQRLQRLNRYACWVDAGFVDEPGRSHKAVRYEYAWRRVPLMRSGTLPSRALARAADASGGRMALLTHNEQVHAGRRQPLPGGLSPDQLATGEMWFDVSRAAADELLERLAGDPGWLSHFRRTWIPDEGLLPTLLLTGNGLVAPAADRFIRWSPAAHHPDTLVAADVPLLLASGASFGRKFTPGSDALTLLDRAAGYEGPVPLPAD